MVSLPFLLELPQSTYLLLVLLEDKEIDHALLKMVVEEEVVLPQVLLLSHLVKQYTLLLVKVV